jgi:hypothetical protein
MPHKFSHSRRIERMKQKIMKNVSVSNEKLSKQIISYDTIWFSLVNVAIKKLFYTSIHFRGLIRLFDILYLEKRFFFLSIFITF